VQNIDEEDEEEGDEGFEDQYEEEVVEDQDGEGDNERTSPTPLVQDQPVFVEYGKKGAAKGQQYQNVRIIALKLKCRATIMRPTDRGRTVRGSRCSSKARR
jgi:hypothetical protein